MKVGIMGVPASGKTCLFNALTRGRAEAGHFGSGRREIRRGHVVVPDGRLDWLAEHYHSRKKTPAGMDVLDVPGIVPGSSEKLAASLIADLRTVDALLHVVRVFENPSVAHPEGSVDPVRDAHALETELLLADLAVLENRLHRIRSDLGKGVDRARLEAERELLEPLRSALEEGRAARDAGLSEEDEGSLTGYALLTLKPTVLVGNVGEEDPLGGTADAPLRAHAQETAQPYVALSARIEAELAEMDDSEAEAFLEEWGIAQPGGERVVRAVFAALSLVTFFTFEGEECRAWTVPRNSRAVEAAGKIHSDMARGFIRAEVVPYEALREAGSWQAAKEAGRHRLEGKDYVMQDGDCVIFRFHV